MIVTPEQAERMYLMLCSFYPFKKWHLPNTGCIQFIITDEEDCFGSYEYDGEMHIVTLSRAKCHHYETWLKTLCHEMIHMKRYKTHDWDKHDAIFRRYAAQIAKEFNFDPLEL